MISHNQSGLQKLALLAIVLVVALTLAAAQTRADSLGAMVQATEPIGLDVAAPLVLSYQGRLADPLSGGAKPDGTYLMAFALYDVESGGSPLWSETKDILVKGGLFSTRLGDLTALPPIFDGRALWLGITVGGDPQASPRLPVSFVAYALYANRAGTAGAADLAGNANLLGGQPPASYAAAGHTHDAAAVTGGTLAYDRFSAYGDLANDGKIGPAAGMVAAGIHSHTGSDIADGSIGTADIADGSITSAKLADGGVVNADLAANSVDSNKIIDLSIATTDLANGSITSAKIADGGVGSTDLASSSVTSDKIADGGVATADLADGSVISAKIADGSVTNADLAANSVDSAKIADGGVANADLANSSVTTAKLADGTVTSAKLASGVVPKSFSLNIFAAYLTTGAIFETGWGPYAGLSLPDNISPAFSHSFTIPPNYTPGTDMMVQIIWNTPSTSCGIELRPNYISVARAGRTHISGPSVTDGLTMIGGTTLSAPPTANQSSAKTMRISTPSPGTNLLAGDSVIFGLYRPAAAATDTCTGDLMIQGISVSYQ